MVYASDVIKEPDAEEPKPEKQTLLSKYEIPVQHLDFSYVKQCSDGKELERILKVLRSNEEGYFPELIKETENRLSVIKPKSKLLRELTTVLPKNALDKEEQNQLTQDMQDWLSKMKHISKELESCKIKNVTPHDAIPEVRKVKQIKADNSQTTKRIKSTDYESWDKYDPDTEILKMDLEEEKLKKRVEKETKEKPKIEPIAPKIHFTTKAEAELEAQKERLKGNEFFKTLDYDYAIIHYTRSIEAKPTAPCYTNRALCYIKLKKYSSALKDCQDALKIDKNNIKAYLRSAECLEHMKQYDSAIEQVDTALQIEPNNPYVQKAAKQLEKYRQSNGKSTRLKIDNVSNSSKSEVDFNNSVIKQQKAVSKNIQNTKSQSISNKVKTSVDDYKIIPYAGTSKMPPPYYKVVHNNQIKNNKFDTNAIVRKPQLLHLTVIDNSSDDEENTAESIQSRMIKAMQNKTLNRNLVIHDLPEKKQTEVQNKKENMKEHRKIINPSLIICDVPEEKLIEVQSNRDIERNEIATPKENRLSDKQQILLNDKGGGGEPCVRGISPETINIEDLNSPYSFLKAWNSIAKDTSYMKHAEILKNLNAENLIAVIGNKLDSKMLSDILKCMRLHFKTPQEANKVHELLVNLTRMPRFNIVKLFLCNDDKENFAALKEFLNAENKDLSEDIKNSFTF